MGYLSGHLLRSAALPLEPILGSARRFWRLLSRFINLNLVEQRHLASIILIPGGLVSALWRRESAIDPGVGILTLDSCGSRWSWCVCSTGLYSGESFSPQRRSNSWRTTHALEKKHKNGLRQFLNVDFVPSIPVV